MFRILPYLNVRLRDIDVGSIVTTILVLAGKSLVDWYLGTAALEPAYKAAGSFVIFLIWIYYNVQVMLIGAIFTQVYTSRYGGKVQPYWDAHLHDEWY
jgi:membrane protein